MYKKLFVCLFLLNALIGHSKITPAEHARLHYNNVYFEEEFVKSAYVYNLIYFDSSAGHARSNEKKISSKLPAFQTENLDWNAQYYWYVRSEDKNHHAISVSALHHFELMKVVSQNNEETRLLIKTNKTNKQAGGFICLDYSRSIYNREGKVIWTIPAAEFMHPQQNQIRDMKMTAENTLTFLNGNFPLEIDLEGNILWSAPHPFTINSDTVFYHHDFKKTSRGTYMVMGNKRAFRKVIGDIPAEKLNKEFEVKMIDGQLYCKVLMNIILEFNKEGKLIWFWDSNDYITDLDLNFKKSPMKIPSFATHANAFSENEAGTKVYVGFRDLSRIVKIDKLSKKVEQSYGEKYPSGEARLGANLFKRQHDATITKRNTLLILNNNSPPGGGGGVSSVLEIKDSGTQEDSLIVWKFNLDFDTLSNGRSISGGDVIELPNSDLLVCAGLLNRVFEVSRKKEIVWDAFVQAKGLMETNWRDSPQYRCNWIKELKWYRFLAEHISTKTKGNDLQLQIKIYNTCKQEDNYLIDLVDENGWSYLKTETKLLKPDNFLIQDLIIPLNDLSSKQLRVLIKSKHSSELKILNISKSS